MPAIIICLSDVIHSRTQIRILLWEPGFPSDFVRHAWTATIPCIFSRCTFRRKAISHAYWTLPPAELAAETQSVYIYLFILLPESNLSVSYAKYAHAVTHPAEPTLYSLGFSVSIFTKNDQVSSSQTCCGSDRRVFSPGVPQYQGLVASRTVCLSPSLYLSPDWAHVHLPMTTKLQSHNRLDTCGDTRTSWLGLCQSQ